MSIAASDRACMAIALHHEARGESLKGVRGVYDVIKSRMRHSGKSACQVVREPSQFSFVKRRMSWKPTYEMLYRLDSVVAMKRVVGKHTMWYYAVSIRKPAYLRGMVFVKQVGRHRFFKLKEK